MPQKQQQQQRKEEKKSLGDKVKESLTGKTKEERAARRREKAAAERVRPVFPLADRLFIALSLTRNSPSSPVCPPPG